MSGNSQNPHVPVPHLVAGLDIGTSNIKLSVFTSAGRPLFQQAVPYQTYFPHPGWAEQSPGDWTSLTMRLLREMAQTLGSRCQNIAALGLSAHAPSLIFMSQTGESLFDRAPIWSDERSDLAAKRLIEIAGDGFIGLGMPSSSFAAKLYWFRMEHKAPEAALLVGIKAYITKWLTGELAADPSSEPARDPRWANVVGACGFGIETLPVGRPPDSIIGTIRNELCDEAGLPRSIPVAIGLNDGGSSVLSSGAYRTGDVVIELATNGVVYHVAQDPISSTSCLEQALFCWPYVEDHWIDGGQTRCGAVAFRWAAKTCGVSEPLDLHSVLGLAQASPPGSNGLMFFPYLAGQGTPRDNPRVKGTLFGLALTTRQSDFYRSVVEGVSYAIREIFDTLRRSGLSLNRLFIAGGGSQSAFCRQVIADMLDSQLLWARTNATLGAAILASVAVGIHASIEEAVCQMVPPQTETIPDRKASQRYEELANRYYRIRDQISELYSANNE